MTGRTLLLSRNVNLHTHYKMRLTELGFTDVTVSAADRDELYTLIRELKPHLVLISFAYKHCCTHFVIGECTAYAELAVSEASI